MVLEMFVGKILTRNIKIVIKIQHPVQHADMSWKRGSYAYLFSNQIGKTADFSS